MKIAVTYENGNVFGHFGHTAQFKLYDTDGKNIISSQIVDTNGSGHGALAGFLSGHNVDVLICGGIGGGAKNALKDAGILLFGGVTGNADEAVTAYLEGRLAFDPQVQCTHHDQEHHEHGSCGSHGCGTHSCH